MNTPTELPQLFIEQPPHDEAESTLLAQFTELVSNAAPQHDLRDLAPDVRLLFPEPVYLVGCGSAHIWLHRTNDPNRLALIR